MSEKICNYSLIRYKPDLVKGEFGNVGVLVICDEINFLDFKIQATFPDKFKHFFSEIENVNEVYWINALSLSATMKRCCKSKDISAKDSFMELAKPSNNMFQFSEIRTILCDDPAVKLDELFENYIL